MGGGGGGGGGGNMVANWASNGVKRFLSTICAWQNEEPGF